MAALPDPVGELLSEWTRPNGLRIRKVRVPIGGTWITEHGLFGTWTVRVYLDRETVPGVVDDQHGAGVAPDVAAVALDGVAIEREHRDP